MRFNFLNKLDADDIFISYSREDGETYLDGLSDALTKLEFACFDDRQGTDAGPLPPQTLFRKIRNCRTLILLATPGAIRKSKYLAEEVRHFADANGTTRIVAVSFDKDDKELDDWSSAEWYDLVNGKSRARELPERLESGKPSPTVVSRIEKKSDYLKSKDRLRKYRNQAFAGFLALVVAIIAAGGVAWYQLRRAAAATANANAETQRAKDATEAADLARAQAKTAQDAADLADKKAKEQTTIAELAAKDAKEKTKLAEEASRKAQEAQHTARAAQAEANRQQSIAEARSLANRSQTLLRQRPEEVPRSISLAVASMKKSSAVGLHAVEADSALRENLALFPTLRSTYQYAQGEGLGDVAAITLSPDGKHFALVNNEKLRVYESGTQTLLKEVDCKCSKIALNSGATRAAAIMNEGGINMFELKTGGSRILTLAEDESPEHLALSPGGQYLALTARLGEGEGQHSKVSVWEVASGKLIKSFDDYVDTPGDKKTDAAASEVGGGGQTGDKPAEGCGDLKLNMLIYDVAFGPSGNLAVGGKDNSPQGVRLAGQVVLWNLLLRAEGVEADRKLTAADFANYLIVQQQAQVNAVTPGTDDTYFATDTGVWKRLTGRIEFEPIARLPHELTPPLTAQIAKLAFGPDGKSLTLVRTTEGDQHSKDNDEGVLETWDATGHRDAVSAFQPKEIVNAGFKPGAELVVAMTGQPSSEEMARVYNASDGQMTESLTFKPESSDTALKSVSPSADFIINVENGVAVVWDVWQKTKVSVTLDDTLQDVKHTTISPGGKFFALSGKDKNGGQSVVVYSSSGGSYQFWKSIPQHKDLDLGEMLLSADGQRLVVINTYVCSFPRVWDVSNERDVSPEILTDCNEVVKPGAAFLYDVGQMALSRDGRFLVMSDLDNRTRLLDLSEGRKAKLIPLVDNALVTSLAFSPNGQYLGIGSDEGFLYVFETGKRVDEIARLQHTGRVTTVTFSRQVRGDREQRAKPLQ